MSQTSNICRAITVMCFAVLLASISPAAHAQVATTQQYSDDDLYDMGFQAYNKGSGSGNRWDPASALGFLVAYVQRGPDRLSSDPKFAKDLIVLIDWTQKSLSSPPVPAAGVVGILAPPCPSLPSHVKPKIQY